MLTYQNVQVIYNGLPIRKLDLMFELKFTRCTEVGFSSLLLWQ